MSSNPLYNIYVQEKSHLQIRGVRKIPNSSRVKICVAPRISFTLVLGLSAGLRRAIFSFSRKLWYQASRRNPMLQWRKNGDKNEKQTKGCKHSRYGILLGCKNWNVEIYRNWKALESYNLYLLKMSWEAWRAGERLLYCSSTIEGEKMYPTGSSLKSHVRLDVLAGPDSWSFQC